jgi:hypothetical protein
MSDQKLFLNDSKPTSATSPSLLPSVTPTAPPVSHTHAFRTRSSLFLRHNSDVVSWTLGFSRSSSPARAYCAAYHFVWWSTGAGLWEAMGETERGIFERIAKKTNDQLLGVRISLDPDQDA